MDKNATQNQNVTFIRLIAIERCRIPIRNGKNSFQQRNTHQALLQQDINLFVPTKKNSVLKTFFVEHPKEKDLQ